MLTPTERLSAYWEDCALCGYQMEHDHGDLLGQIEMDWTWVAAMAVAEARATPEQRWFVGNLPRYKRDAGAGGNGLVRVGWRYWPQPVIAK